MRDMMGDYCVVVNFSNGQPIVLHEINMGDFTDDLMGEQIKFSGLRAYFRHGKWRIVNWENVTHVDATRPTDSCEWCRHINRVTNGKKLNGPSSGS